MYKKLYESWKREAENAEIQRLPSNFYSETAHFFQKLKEEGRMLDKRSVKAKILRDEIRKVKRIFQKLFEIRYNKLVEKATKGQKIPSDFLTVEEKRFYTSILPFTEELQNLAEDIPLGYTPKEDRKQELKKTVVRFVNEVPAIIGADMSTYGPFKTGDVASLPVENSKILIKKNLAKRVEVQFPREKV